MNSKAIAILLSVFAAMPSAPSQNNDKYDTVLIDGQVYELSFEDNFDGNELDQSKWERCPEQKRQDLENYWDDSMSWVDGEGNLVIAMSYDPESGRYLSGGIRSKGRFEQTFGYYEIRCKINNVPGYWTAFWLMNDSVLSENKGGTDGTEIDIYESPLFVERKIQHTLNWDGYSARHKAMWKITNADVYDGNYHTFALLWTEKEYVYYIDGNETWRTGAEKAGGTCQVPLYMKITSETGSWVKIPADPESLPDYMITDYVRVYRTAGQS